MSKVIASLALVSCTFLLQLGNMWFTYGIWPKEWSMYALFWVLGLINYSLLTAVMKEEK